MNQDNKGEVLESVNVLPDEILAHRLAMIPIPTFPEEGIHFSDACPNCIDLAEESKGCPSCQVLYSLSARGPTADAEEDYKTVYAGDLTTISDQMFDIRDEHKRIPSDHPLQGAIPRILRLSQPLGEGETMQSGRAAAAIGFRPQRTAKLNKPKKAGVLFDLGLKTTDGKAIDAKLFGKDKTITDVNHVIDLESALHQVGPGTNRDGDFDDAITLEEVENAYVFSFETDGSLTPEQAFNGAMSELSARFENLTEDIERAFA